MNIIKNKKLRITLALLAALVFFQFISFFWYAQSIIPRTGFRQLSDYARSDHRKFAVIESENWASLSRSQKDVLIAEIGTIYHSMLVVPEENFAYAPITEDDKAEYEDWKRRNVPARFLEQRRREMETGRHVIGIKNGIELSWHIDDSGLFWSKCTAGDWVGNLGAEDRTDLYIWILGYWIQVHNYDRIMS